MNKKSTIKLIYKKKLDLFQKYNKFYFDKSAPIVSDKEYDDLMEICVFLKCFGHVGDKMANKRGKMAT